MIPMGATRSTTAIPDGRPSEAARRLGMANFPKCFCGDRQANRVAELVGQGWDQFTASLWVYTGNLTVPPEPPAPEVGDAQWRQWVTAYVRHLTAPWARRWNCLQGVNDAKP